MLNKTDLSSLNILVAVPAYNDIVRSGCVASLIQLEKIWTELRIEHETHIATNGTLLPRLRNWFANLLLFGPSLSGKCFTHILFLDSDITFHPEDILTLLKLDKPISALPCANNKGVEWPVIIKALQRGARIDQLPLILGTPDDASPVPVDVPTPMMNGSNPIVGVGTGVLLVKKEVFVALAEAHPEWGHFVSEQEPGYRDPEKPGKRGVAFNFFQIGIEPISQTFICEDFFFRMEAGKLGFPTYVHSPAVTRHTGMVEFEMNLTEMEKIKQRSNIEAAAARNQ